MPTLPSLPIIPMIALVLLGAAAYGLWGFWLPQLQSEVDELDALLKQKQAERDAAIGKSKERKAEYQRKNDRVRRQLQLVDKLLGKYLVKWSQIFVDLTALVPKETVWLKSLSYESSGYKLTFQGEAIPPTKDEETGDEIDLKDRRNYAAVEQFIKNIKVRTERYSEPFLSSASLGKRFGRNVVSFHMTCKVKKIKRRGEE